MQKLFLINKKYNVTFLNFNIASLRNVREFNLFMLATVEVASVFLFTFSFSTCRGVLRTFFLHNFSVFIILLVKMASPTPKKPILSTLGQLKTWTTVVADTGDFEGNLKYLTLSCKVQFIFFLIFCNVKGII